MSEILLIFVWTVATLAIATISILLGRRYSVAFPVGMMGTLMVVATILANKLVTIGPFVVTAGILVYSSTFIITDLLSEMWSKKQAQTAVWVGFWGMIFLSITLWFAIMWPSPIFAQEMSETFAKALSLTPRIAFAALLTYIIVQHLDVWLFHFWKNFTNGKHLWLRNNASTLVSQLLDTVLFATMAFYGVIPILPLIVGSYIVKVAIALIDTPFMYGIRYIARKIEPVKFIE